LAQELYSSRLDKPALFVGADAASLRCFRERGEEVTHGSGPFLNEVSMAPCAG